MVGCVPGKYLLPPPRGIVNRQPDPASEGSLTCIHRSDLYRYNETLDHRPVWLFADKHEWWDSGGGLPGVEKADQTQLDPLPPSGTPERELKLLSELASAKRDLAELRGQVLLAIDRWSKQVDGLKLTLGIPVD